ncbi:MAG: DUF1573 domain-containing protein [Candidatus Azambacteria bacterium]|nr:DUF1573 domain-containing protein [Candidatus Azambacteria bacterium]
MDKNTKLTIIIVAAILLALAVFGVIATDMKDRLGRIERQLEHLDEEVDEVGVNVKRLTGKITAPQDVSIEKQGQLPRAELDVREYDFGKITKIAGIVNTKFTIRNTGESALTIGEMLTSCSCTSATTDKISVPAGESASITVAFDPNFHEEPQGRFFRSVFIPTNDPANQEIELKIYVEIIN